MVFVHEARAACNSAGCGGSCGMMSLEFARAIGRGLRCFAMVLIIAGIATPA